MVVIDLAFSLGILEMDDDPISNWLLGLWIGWLGSFLFSLSATIIANGTNWFQALK